MTVSTHPLAGAAVPGRRDASRRPEADGMLLGLVGVAMFSLTLPFTRMAVAELDPQIVTFGRASGAALLAGLWLLWRRAPLPPRSALPALALVALGCIVGFPLLTSVALRSLPAAHGAVLVGVLPLATALCAAMRGDERPSAGFWLMAVLGAALVAIFALRQGGGAFHSADLLVFGAVAAAAVGYAEGARVARTLGGSETICWALLLAAPVMAPLLAWNVLPQFGALARVGAPAWIALAT